MFSTQLRDQRDTIEGLVDEVVQGYHNGFNKAIHNYSQILQLFTNCKMHVNTLRSSLEQAKIQLGTQSRSLQQQVKTSAATDQPAVSVQAQVSMA